MITLIKNGIVLTMNARQDWYADGYVILEDKRILAVGPSEGLEEALYKLELEGKKPDAVRDAGRGILMPGMVNTHCHLSMIPFRGLGDDCRDRLRVFLLPMEQRAMSGELIRSAAKYAAAELLLSGVTTVMDMYYYAGEVADVMDEMGIRGIAGQTVMDQGACDFQTPEESVSYGVKQMERYRNHERVSCCLTPHATNTCSPEYLKQAYLLDREYQVPFTLHTAEMDYEMSYFREKHGCSPVEYLDRLGVLGPETLLAHCIHLDEEDLERLKRSGASVAHCIGSNTKAAKGVAPVLGMRSRQICVGLGTDGPASGNTLDLFTQMKLCANFHKNESRDRSAMKAMEILSMATAEGARALGLGQITGSIEPGKAADLVLVETDSVNMFPVYEPDSALVYSASPFNVRDVYVDGRLLVENHRLKEQDLGALKNDLKERMERSAFGENAILA